MYCGRVQLQHIIPRLVVYEGPDLLQSRFRALVYHIVLVCQVEHVDLKNNTDFRIKYMYMYKRNWRLQQTLQCKTYLKRNRNLAASLPNIVQLRTFLQNQLLKH